MRLHLKIIVMLILAGCGAAAYFYLDRARQDEVQTPGMVAEDGEPYFALVVASLVGIVILSKTMPQARPLTGGELALIIGGKDTTPVGEKNWKCGGTNGTSTRYCQAMRWVPDCLSQQSENSCNSAGWCEYCDKGPFYKYCIKDFPEDTCISNPGNGKTTSCKDGDEEGRHLRIACQWISSQCTCPQKGSQGWNDLGICDLTNCE
jgi:hypothetical protein